MTLFVFSNFVQTTLSATFSSSAPSMTLSSSFGLPSSIPAGYYFVITLNDAATRSNFEVIYATSVSGATLSGLIRGREGTTALNWSALDYAYSGVTAGQMGNMVQIGAAAGGALTGFYPNPGLNSNYAVYSFSGSFTPPTGITRLKVRAWGGGGGGGGTYGFGSAAAGGGGAGYCEGIIPCTPGTPITLTVGTAGSGGLNGSSPTSGGNGTATIIGDFFAGPGGGGNLANSGVANTGGGTGGSGSGAAINLTGQNGGYGFAQTSSDCFGGPGGGTFCSSLAWQANNSTGIPGSTPGGGGGGGSLGNPGGSGAVGLIIIEY